MILFQDLFCRATSVRLFKYHDLRTFMLPLTKSASFEKEHYATSCTFWQIKVTPLKRRPKPGIVKL